MNDTEKTCPRCAEQVKAAALVCRFCGHEFGDGASTKPSPADSVQSFARPSAQPTSGINAKSIAGGIIVVVIIIVALGYFIGSHDGTKGVAESKNAAPAADVASPTIPMPADEAKFIAGVQAARSAYNSAPNDMAKGGTRADRRRAICEALSGSASANQWTGTIAKLSSNGDGKGVLYISIADDVTIGTWNNALSDIEDNTLMDQSSPAFKAASAMKEGDKVVFSGTFIPSETDCIRETSMTLEGSMQEPEFLIRFESVSAALLTGSSQTVVEPAPPGPAQGEAPPQEVSSKDQLASSPTAPSNFPTPASGPAQSGGPSYRTSFSCDAATKVSEKLVCSDPQLAALDVELASIYRSARESAADPATLVDEQRGWLDQRDACSNVSCLREAYLQRRADLARWLPGGGR